MCSGPAGAIRLGSRPLVQWVSLKGLSLPDTTLQGLKLNHFMILIGTSKLVPCYKTSPACARATSSAACEAVPFKLTHCPFAHAPSK